MSSSGRAGRGSRVCYSAVDSREMSSSAATAASRCSVRGATAVVAGTPLPGSDAVRRRRRNVSASRSHSSTSSSPASSRFARGFGRAAPAPSGTRFRFLWFTLRGSTAGAAAGSTSRRGGPSKALMAFWSCVAAPPQAVSAQACLDCPRRGRKDLTLERLWRVQIRRVGWSDQSCILCEPSRTYRAIRAAPWRLLAVRGWVMTSRSVRSLLPSASRFFGRLEQVQAGDRRDLATRLLGGHPGGSLSAARAHARTRAPTRPGGNLSRSPALGQRSESRGAAGMASQDTQSDLLCLIVRPVSALSRCALCALTLSLRPHRDRVPDRLEPGRVGARSRAGRRQQRRAVPRARTRLGPRLLQRPPRPPPRERDRRVRRRTRPQVSVPARRPV